MKTAALLVVIAGCRSSGRRRFLGREWRTTRPLGSVAAFRRTSFPRGWCLPLPGWAACRTAAGRSPGASRRLVSAASVAGGGFDHSLHAAGAWP